MQITTSDAIARITAHYTSGGENKQNNYGRRQDNGY